MTSAAFRAKTKRLAAIVSERMVRAYFPGGPGEALGRRVRLGDRGEWLTVVGVVADIRQDRGGVSAFLQIPRNVRRQVLECGSPRVLCRFVTQGGKAATAIELGRIPSVENRETENLRILLLILLMPLLLISSKFVRAR